MDSIKTNEAEGAAIARITLLRPKRAAQLLGVTEGSLAVWRCTKRYPLRFIKVGRHIRYRLQDIEDFLRLRTEAGDGGASSRRHGSAN